MKKMKLTAIVLGLAAAGAFAQAAPAAAQPAAQPAADQKTVADQKAVEEATKAEEAKAAEEAKKAEEAKAAEAQKEEKKDEKGEVSSASLLDRLNISKADDAPEAKKALEFKLSGAAEIDAYGYWKNDNEKDLYHDYWSTLDLDFEVKFSEQWSAQVEIEADGFGTDPGVHYNGAFLQYKDGDNFAVKVGDLTHAEGAFNYYGYDDPADNAAGMAEHDIRGFEVDVYGLELALGFGRGDNDNAVYNCDGGNCQGKSYDVHAAYQLEFAGQALRPFAHYKSWQEKDANELHAGLEAALEFGPFAIHAVYGLHADRLTEDEPKATHAFLAEPQFKVSNVNVKAGFFYALFDDKDPTVHDGEIPEYMFAYGEANIILNKMITLGIVGELHTNSLDDDTDLGSLNFGPRFYFTPIDGLEVTAFVLGILPMGNDWEKDGHDAWVSTEDYGEDVDLKFGVEAVFSF